MRQKWPCEPKLPCQRLREVRASLGMGRREFAERSGWSYWTLRRLEEHLEPFMRSHLDALVTAGWFKKDSIWYQRFEQAIAYQAAALHSEKRQSQMNLAELDQPATANFSRAAQYSPGRELAETGSWPVEEIERAVEAAREALAELSEIPDTTRAVAAAFLAVLHVLERSDSLSTQPTSSDARAVALIACTAMLGMDRALESFTERVGQLLDEMASPGAHEQ